MINLFDKLPAEEVELARQYIANYAGFHGDYTGYPTVSMEKILSPWGEAKQDLYKLLDEQFIYSKEIEFNLSTNELSDRVYKELTNNHPFVSEYYKALRKTFLEPENPDDYNWEAYQSLCLLADSWYLATNTFDYPVWRKECVFIFPGQTKPTKFARGMKTMRALAKISKMLGLSEQFEEFRIAHSMVLNNVKVKGTLCLSIHPVDYMTMSDNDNNWESCMSWMRGGEYRQGTVEMMNSKYVVVGYVKSDSHILETYAGDWNSKQWRQLFIVDKDIILAIRPYPYTNDAITDNILGILKELAEKNMGWKYANDKVATVDNNTDSNEFNGSPLSVQLMTNVMYNDCYTGLRCYIGEGVNGICLNHSGLSECMKCGQTYENCGWPMGDDDLLCDCCDSPRVYCSHCDERFRVEDMIEINGEYYCEYCANEISFTCRNCYETYYEDDKVEIAVMTRSHGEYSWDRYTPFDTTVCKYCADEFETCLRSLGIEYEGCVDDYSITILIEDFNNEKLFKYFDASQAQVDRWWDGVAGKREKEYLANMANNKEE